MCFSWGEAGGERGAWFESMSAQKQDEIPGEKEKKKKPTKIETHRSKNRKKKRDLYTSAEPSLAKVERWGPQDVTDGRLAAQ